MYRRPAFAVLRERLEEPRRFIQVVTGPRQTGKSTLARQVLEAVRMPSVAWSADDSALPGHEWVEQAWEAGRRSVRAARGRRGGVLVLDEVQKVPRWSEAVKRLWDDDTRHGFPLRVVLLGSSTLLVERGLAESLAGRFEVVHSTHWPYAEMRAAFGWDVDRFVYFGGYPGAAKLTRNRPRWARYVRESLIEPTLARDVLMLSRVERPALLRRLFALGCSYSGQILSYTKMLGQLQDPGNTTTLAHYLDLLSRAGLLCGLQKYSGSEVRERGSSPKLQVFDTGLMSAMAPYDQDEVLDQPRFRGRLVETAVGAHLVNGTIGSELGVHYWRDRGHEVDFVLTRGERTCAIEVASGAPKDALPGAEAFRRAHPGCSCLLVGSGGVALEEFLLTPPAEWLATPAPPAASGRRRSSRAPAGSRPA